MVPYLRRSVIRSFILVTHMSKFVSVIPEVFVKVIKQVASSSSICALHIVEIHRNRLDVKTRDWDLHTNLPTTNKLRPTDVCLAASMHY
jgi:hypothetical protein